VYAKEGAGSVGKQWSTTLSTQVNNVS
jgi:hypothetical protein